jgi:hypothetical protein
MRPKFILNDDGIVARVDIERFARLGRKDNPA